jgi:uncharacterized membrane protein YcaP (DUF421 family)
MLTHIFRISVVTYLIIFVHIITEKIGLKWLKLKAEFLIQDGNKKKTRKLDADFWNAD